jgi:hypothetical protein
VRIVPPFSTLQCALFKKAWQASITTFSVFVLHSNPNTEHHSRMVKWEMSRKQNR